MSPSNDDVSRIGSGIDLRSDATVCAISSGSKTVPLEFDGKTKIPTRLEIDPTGETEAGVYIGDNAKGHHGSVINPLPWSRDGIEKNSRLENYDIPVSAFLRGVRSHWKDALPEALSRLNVDSGSLSSAPKMEHVVMTVPGSFTDAEASDTEAVLEAAGFDPVSVIRNPIPLAVIASSQMGSNGRLLAVDVGSQRTDVAVININQENLTYEVIGRASSDTVGKRALEESLVEWAIERTARNRGISLEYDSDTIEAVRSAARAVITGLSKHPSTNSDDNDSIRLAIADVPVVDAPGGISSVDIDINIGATDLSKAFSEPVSELSELVNTAVDRAGVETDSIDDVIAAGSAVQTGAVSRAIEGVVGMKPRKPDIPVEEIPAQGAAYLAAWSKRTDVTVRDETHDTGYGVVVGSGTEKEYVEILEPGEIQDSGSVRLATTVENQQNAHLSVVSRHPVTGQLDEEFGIEVGQIPPRDMGEVTFNLSIERAQEATDFDIEHDDSSELESLVAALKPEGIDHPDIPPLTCADDAEPSRTVEHTATSDGELATRVRPDSSVAENTDVESVISRLYGIRTDLSRIKQSEEEAVPLEEVDRLIRKFDNSSKFLGIEPIDPDPGTEIDAAKHQEVGQRKALSPAGSIAEVVRPGYIIDDYTAQLAKVIVSEGPPDELASDSESQSDSENSEEVVTDKAVEANEDPTEQEPESKTQDEIADNDKNTETKDSGTSASGSDKTGESDDEEIEYRTANNPEENS